MPAASDVRSSPASPRFFLIKLRIGIGKQFFDALSVAAIDADTDTCGERRHFRIDLHHVTDTGGDAFCFRFFRLRQYQSEFVPTIAGSGIDCAAMNAQYIRNSR